MQDFDNEEFLNSLRNREHKAISQLIESYQLPLTKGALAHKVSIEEAEDIVAETWGTFFEKVENFEGRSKLKTYLFGVMYNKVRELRKKTKKYVNFEDPLDMLGSNFDKDGFWAYTPTEPDAFAEAHELQGTLDGCMDSLTENQKRIFHLKEVEGKSSNEICEIIDISNANLKVSLHRARNQIRRCIEASNA